MSESPKVFEDPEDERASFTVHGFSARAVLHLLVMRCVDRLAGLVLLTIFMPVLLVLAVAIRLDSRGPALFLQTRVGRGERLFTLVKFRTMTVGTPQAGTHEITSASITRIGRYLRHYKIDELPQAWNLLVGNLALVGPRPCLPSQSELIQQRRKHGVYSVLPGLTGLAQVKDVDMSDPPRLAALDADYIRRRTLRLDMIILAKTFLGAGKGDRVSIPDR